MDDRRVATPAGSGGGAWRQLWSRAGFVPGLLAAALANGTMFAMVTASSFVLIGEQGWSSAGYAWFYAIASVAFILACQANVALLARMRAGAILVRACAAIAAIGAVLTLLSIGGRLSGGVYAAGCGVSLGLLGFVLGNALAVAMAQVPAAIAGRAASVMGVVQFGMGAVIAGLATAAQPVSRSAALTILATAAAALLFAGIGARQAIATIDGDRTFS